MLRHYWCIVVYGFLYAELRAKVYCTVQYSLPFDVMKTYSSKPVLVSSKIDFHTLMLCTSVHILPHININVQYTVHYRYVLPVQCTVLCIPSKCTTQCSVLHCLIYGHTIFLKASYSTVNYSRVMKYFHLHLQYFWGKPICVACVHKT